MEQAILDPSLQMSLLKRLEAVYPEQDDLSDLPDGAAVMRNLSYLFEHGLVEIEVTQWMNAPSRVADAKITARGLDYLAPDGGLTAALGVVTVRIEAESIRALIAARLESAEGTPAEKSQLMKHVNTVSTEVLKTVTKRLVEVGLARSPDVIQLLRTLLGFVN